MSLVTYFFRDTVYFKIRHIICFAGILLDNCRIVEKREYCF